MEFLEDVENPIMIAIVGILGFILVSLSVQSGRDGDLQAIKDIQTFAIVAGILLGMTWGLVKYTYETFFW
jgi:xanthosine utilization system XapX-like protein